MINNALNENELVKKLYHDIYRIRFVEEEIIRLYPSDVIKSPVHLSIGQESISVGVCNSLKKNDTVFGTYRGHALYLAKGGSLNAMMAELFGKVDGCCQGKGGSMHLIDPSVNMMGTSAVVASSISEAVGYALGIKYKGGNEIVVCFFGDGATDQGVFHESLNFASLKKLPILFVCENNNFAIHSRLSERSAQENLYKFAEVYNIPTHVLKDSDIFKLCELTNSLVDKIRNGSGPHFIEAYTYRWLEHVGPQEDWGFEYRSEEEIFQWKVDDQVNRLRKMINPVDRKNIDKQVKDEIASALKFAEQSAFPSKLELYKNVYK
jgi:TPP-dependent pyruvate/acetoin dehydrogenase alpha subunit